MSAEQLLSELRALDVRLSVDDGQLHCSAPKGRLTGDLQQRIAAHKPELIRALRATAPQPVAIPGRSIHTAGLPLSFAQERFWFLQNLDPDSTAYNLTAYQRVPARVNAAALESSLRATLQKHEILRTNFRELDGVPIQMIRDESSLELAIYDLAEVAEVDRLAAAEAMIEKLSRSRFDLARDPLLRAALIRLDERDHFLVLTLHHIVCDGWSIGILFSELKSFYEAYSRGRPVSLRELPIQFGDYVVWERDRQTSAILEPQIEYWKKKLEGAPQHIDIPLDRMRPTSAGSEVGLHRFQLDPSTSESLKRIAREDGATLFMTLLTVFKTLLFRYSGQNDIVVGTPVSTRTRPELEQLIGCLINTLVLRTEITAEATTRELLASVRRTVLESLHNADVPFETLVSKLPTERDLSRSPLFQIAFILQNTALSSEYRVITGGTTLDLTLYMWESDGRIGGSVEYKMDLFDAATIARFAGCYCTLAAEMASQPDSAIGRFALITEGQEAEWLKGYNGLRISYPQDLCTHEWVERQARETPEAIAVVCGQEKLTYQELSVRSNRLAHRLRALGVGPESLVGLCLDRSPDLVVAPLAVWKAGGAYVPLDPEYPSSRLAFMLEDSAAVVLITESHLVERLPGNLGRVICLDRDRRLLEQESAQAPAPLAKPDNLAYLIYTSGSTGKPKGVEIEHRSVVNLLASMQREPGMSRADRLLAVTTLSFDIAGLELYLPLVSGAQVVIAPRTAVFDGAALAGMLRDSAITIMQATPVTWRLLLESGWEGTPGLKILCGGEALSREHAERLLATGSEVWNLYGPTETTIWSTLQRVESGAGRVPIGHPIANTEVYVMDEYGQPVPPGVTGELYIGGEGVARGYLRREELTAARFVNHPYHVGERLYRTGDLGRRLADGRLECIARVDQQVKLRGFRIELGEIEAALEQQAGISQAVVVVREDTAGDQRLTAYVTAPDRSAAAPGVLRKALLGMLPDYMVPSAFVHLDQLPLTPNRKVDRKALPAPAADHRPARSRALPLDEETHLQPRDIQPRNHVELVMSEIWREVLGLERVSVLDNLFELGGHSLTATRLIARLRSTLGMDLPLRCIFIDPTIAGLASHITYDAAAKTYRYTSEIPKWNCLVPVQPQGTRTPFFFIGGAYLRGPDVFQFVLSNLFLRFKKDWPVFGLRPRVSDGISEGCSSVSEAVREFVNELRAVQPRGPYILGGHCVGGVAAIEIAKLLMQEGEEVKLVVLLDTARPSPMLSLRTEFRYQTLIGRIAGLTLQILRARPEERRRILYDLIRGKLRLAQPENLRTQTEVRHYESMIQYRLLLNKHTIARYPGRVTLIVNQHDAGTDGNLGWRGVVEGGLDVHVIPGDHSSIVAHHGKEVGQLILKSIDEALANTGGSADPAEVEVS